MIQDESIWLEILKARNDDTHIYNESDARAYASKIHRDYLPVIQTLVQDLAKYIKEEPDVLQTIPDTFLQAYEESGLYYDEFVSQMLIQYKCQNILELFTFFTLKSNMGGDDGDGNIGASVNISNSDNEANSNSIIEDLSDAGNNNTSQNSSQSLSTKNGVSNRVSAQPITNCYQESFSQEDKEDYGIDL